METQIQSLHFHHKRGLENFIREKMDKLDELFDRLEASKVILKLENSRSKQNKTAEVSMRMPGMRLFAQDRSSTFEEAVVNAINEIKKQIAKHKDKLFNVSPNGKEVSETSAS